jgi:hypothetical protein
MAAGLFFMDFGGGTSIYGLKQVKAKTYRVINKYYLAKCLVICSNLLETN